MAKSGHGGMTEGKSEGGTVRRFFNQATGEHFVLGTPHKKPRRVTKYA